MSPSRLPDLEEAREERQEGLEEAREERQEGLGGGLSQKRKRLSFGHNLSQKTSRMVMNQRALKFFRGHMNVAHRHPLWGGGVGRQAVERARRWGVLAGFSGQRDVNPLARAVRGERQRKFTAAVSTVVNSHRTCCIPFVSVWRLSRFCIAIVIR